MAAADDRSCSDSSCGKVGNSSAPAEDDILSRQTLDPPSTSSPDDVGSPRLTPPSTCPPVREAPPLPLRASTKKNEKKKMFYTTSDLMETMNGAMASVPGSKDAGGGDDVRVELQRRMPDGSTRRANESDLAVANFQSKMKQAAEYVSTLTPSQKVEWSERQRSEGNALYADGEYKEAMDVYMTCLVAMDSGSEKKENGGISNGESREAGNCQGEGQWTNDDGNDSIKIPVLINLALCALKLGMQSKAEKFASFIINDGGYDGDETSGAPSDSSSLSSKGRKIAKAHYLRAKARMLSGKYGVARGDYQRSLALLNSFLDEMQEDDMKVDDVLEIQKEMKAVNAGINKLDALEQEAERNQRRHAHAMRVALGGGSSGTNCRAVFDGVDGNGTSGGRQDKLDGYWRSSEDFKPGNGTSVPDSPPLSSSSDGAGLYKDVRRRRTHSNLRALASADRDQKSARRRDGKWQASDDADDDDDDGRGYHEMSYFQMYLSAVVRCLEKLLEILGPEEGKEGGDFGTSGFDESVVRPQEDVCDGRHTERPKKDL